MKLRKRTIIIMLGITIFCLLMALNIFPINKNNIVMIEPDDKILSDMRMTEPRQGELTESEVQLAKESLGNEAQETMFQITINPDIILDNGTSKANLRIENSPENKYDMKVQIYLDGTKENIYTSSIIEPNFFIQKALLDKELDKGSYNATAVFFAIDHDTKKKVGSAAVKIKIDVQN